LQPITPEERDLLQPLLASEYVHDEVISFKRYESIIRKKCTVKKLGEGSYSSAFLVIENNSSHELTSKSSVIKLIPFQISKSSSNSGSSTGSRDSGTTIEDLLREIRILDSLTKLPGFARARGTHHIVRGKLPKNLTEAFEQFKLDEPEQAQNELSDDDEYSFYGIIEMLYAGKDLDTIKNISSPIAYDIFWMVVIYLARAERDFEFEHRDLHMSNLCYTTHESNGPFNSSNAASVLGRSGFDINIIDYTLSRIKVEDEIVWNPAGSGAGSIQKPPKYETQRMAIWRARECCKKEEVRAAAAGDTQGSIDRWSWYLPKTNVVWLAHVLGELRGRCSEVVNAATTEAEVMQREVAERLKAIEGVLDVDNLSKVPGSAEEVLDLGIEMGWIAREDVVAFGERLNSENS
jgi:serine/threonine-protein kinase haspin